MQCDRAWRLADIGVEVRKALDDQFQKQFVGFTMDSLAWLALPPAWTEPLAEATHFPTDALPLSQFLDRAHAAGFCVRRASTAAGASSFWMPDDARERIIERLKTDTAFGAGKLQEIANRIGREILKVQSQVNVPPVIARWAELAAHSNKVDETVSWLNERVTTLVDSDNTGAASAWIDTGAALANSLGGALKGSVQLGTRRLELVYRKTQNERHLESFQERPEQIEAFNRLIDPRADAWALHYLGMGGVGKTMLLRYIAGRLSTDERTGFPTSRVDFDHLSPDYPVRRPGQLLVELALDLRSYATSSELERRFNELRNRSDRLLEALSGEPPPENPLANIRRPELTSLLGAFTDLLVSLPRREGSPIVLVLDTCEELSRLPTRASIQPGVEATFEILERVHQAVPDVRVILAGRRLLASSGPGWRADETKRSKSGVPLPAREFMRLHEIRGFDRREAHRFLTEKKKLAVAEDVLQAIVERSRETGTVAPVIVEGTSQADDPRFNPFDLSLYANWIREDPGVVIDQIVSGKTDPYVEMRIVYRLRNTPVEPLLPHIVLWQRFDRAMLECAVPDLGHTEVEDLFGKLADLEWIDVQQDEDLGAEYLEVDHNLSPRLLAYFREPPRDRALDAAARRLAAPLASLVRERLKQQGSVVGLTFEHLNAALAAAPAAQGAPLWNELMLRIAASGDWTWALNVTSRLLGEARAIERRPELRAAVLATLTAAELHGGTKLSLTASWEEVERTAPDYPDPVIATWLRDRACAGRVASMLATESSLPDDLVQRFWTLVEHFDPADRNSDTRPWAEQLAASLCAALSAIVERSDRPANRSRLIPDREAIERFAERLNQALYPAELPAFARTLSAEVSQPEGGHADTRVLDDQFSNDSPLTQRWMDWRLPEPLGDHLRLRLWTRRPPPPGQLRTNWLGAFIVKDSLKTIGSIESERLISLLVQWQLADGPQVQFNVPHGPRRVEEPTLALIQEADERAYSPSRQSSCRAHDEVPPLFVSLAMAHLAVGNVDRAQAIVDVRLKAAEASRRDPATVRQAEIARLKIARGMRIPQPGIVGRIQNSKDAVLIAETLAVAALAWPDDVPTSPLPVLNPGDYALVHAWWSAQVALSDETRQQLIESSETLFSRMRLSEGEETPVPADVISAVAFDEQERRLLMRQIGSPPVSSRAGILAAVSPAFGDRSLRSAVRRAALAPEFDAAGLEPSEDDDLRRRAEIAFEEGELLALRLPARGAALLRLAATWYQRAHDPLGAWMSSIAAAIAFWHAGDDDGLRQTLESVTKPAHAELTASGPGRLALPIPPWEDFDLRTTTGETIEAHFSALLGNSQTAPGDIVRELLGHDAPDNYGFGWRMRLTVCRRLAQFKSRSAAEQPFKALAGRLPRRLPAELDPFPELTPSPTPGAAEPNAAPAKSERDWFAWQLGLGGLGLLVLWGYFAFTGRLTPGPTSFLSQPTPVLAWLAVASSFVLLGVGSRVFLSGGHGAALFFPVILLLPPLFFATYWLIGWIAQLILPWEVTGVSHFGFFLTLIVAGLQAGPLTRGIRRWVTSVLAARGWLRVTIEVMKQDPDVVTVSLDGGRTALQPRWPFSGVLNVSSAKPCARPGSSHYVESAGRLAKETRDELHSCRIALGRRSLDVDLVVIGASMSDAWEAMLSLSSLESRIEDDPLRFRRVLAFGRSTASRLRELSPPVREVAFVGDAAWLSMGQKAWASSGVAAAQSPMTRLEATAFLHIVGEPITTTRGVSLKIGGNRHEATASQNIRQEMAPSFSLPELVSADDRVVREAVAALVQMEPADLESRLGTDREQAGHLRVFAAALVSRGVERVITVPALPAGLAEAVLAVLTPALVDPKRHSLTEAVARARGRILAWQFAADAGRSHDKSRTDQLMEIAYDVCLFVGLRETVGRSEGDT